MITKLKSLELVIATVTLAQDLIALGCHIKGKTDEEIRNWTFQQCPHCKMWHDNTESEFCSEWCAGEDYEC